MKINPSLTADANVLQLVNFANGLQLSLADVKFSNARSGTDPNARNSIITLSGNVPTLFRGSADLTYDRRDIIDAAINPTTYYNVDITTTWDQLLQQLVTNLNLVPGEVELVNFNTPLGETLSYVQIQAKAGSSLYTGVLYLILRWEGDDALAIVAMLNWIDKLHTLMNVTLPAPGYF